MKMDYRHPLDPLERIPAGWGGGRERDPGSGGGGRMRGSASACGHHLIRAPAPHRLTRATTHPRHPAHSSILLSGKNNRIVSHHPFPAGPRPMSGRRARRPRLHAPVHGGKPA